MAQQNPKLEQVLNYLSNNHLNEVLCNLTYELTVCKARVDSVDAKIKLCREYLKESAKTGYDGVIVTKIQMAQLDLISALFMLLEDYLSYSHFLRTAKSELPEKILGEKTVTWKEVEFLEGLDFNKTSEYLLLPTLNDFPMLEEREREIVENNLKVYVDDIHSRIKKIVKFFRNHNRVYVKFKHRFPVVLGSIQQNDGILCTFVRDRHRNTKTKETQSYMSSHEQLMLSIPKFSLYITSC